MPSTEAVLSATPTSIQLSAGASRVVVQIIANPATVVATADGSYPTLPSTSTNPAGAVVIAGVLGESGVIAPPLFGNHMQIPTLNLASSGNPTVLISW